MIIDHLYGDNWRLLTPVNIQTRKLWPWGFSVQKIVSSIEQKPIVSKRLLIASDFGGTHRKATHQIYCYLVLPDGGASCITPLKAIRHVFLQDGRRMSYKKLGDPVRQKSLIPFLSAAADLDGHLVAIAVDKRKKWLSTTPDAAQLISRGFGLKASWHPQPLEGMMRKIHLFSILVSLWSRPYTNVTWITDEDEFVANSVRHDDALLAAARLSSIYVRHPMGVLTLNTTGQDRELLEFEDVCAIPDLAAGMLSEVVTGLTSATWNEKMQKVLNSSLPTKADIIADWFWDSAMPLRKTLIAIDVEGAQFAVRKIDRMTIFPKGSD